MPDLNERVGRHNWKNILNEISKTDWRENLTLPDEYFKNRD